MDMKRLVVLALVVCALAYVVYRIGLEDILSVLPKAATPGLLVFFVLHATNVVVRGYRWRMLLNERFPLTEGFRLIFLTAFYNQVSPVRLGDVWRVNECKLSGLGRCTASIITEKVIDVIVLLIVVVASLSSLGMRAESQVVQGVMSSLFMIVAAFLGLQALKQKWFWALASRFIRVEDDQHIHVADFMKERKMFVSAFIITMLIWAIDLVNFWYLANLITPVRFEMTSVALLVSALIGSSIITSVGVAQVLVMIGVLGMNTAPVNAAAIAILWGLVGIWLQIPIGFVIDAWMKQPRQNVIAHKSKKR